MSRVFDHNNAAEFLFGPGAPSALHGLATIAGTHAEDIERPAKALHDLPKCMLADGKLRTDTMLVDQEGQFFHPAWKEAAELIKAHLNIYSTAYGKNAKPLDDKYMTYLSAMHMIFIESGRNTDWPDYKKIQDLLKKDSFVKAVNHQDAVDKHHEHKVKKSEAIAEREEPRLPLEDIAQPDEPKFTGRFNINKGTVTPEGAAASKPKDGAQIA